MAKEVDAHIGRRLVYLRRVHGLSQTDLANHLGVTYQQVQKYETGKNRISASKMYETARVLNVHIQEFFDGLEYRSDDDPRQELPVPTTEMLSLLRAYLSIQDKSERAAVVALLTTLANSADTSEPPQQTSAGNVRWLVPRDDRT